MEFVKKYVKSDMGGDDFFQKEMEHELVNRYLYFRGFLRHNN